MDGIGGYKALHIELAARIVQHARWSNFEANTQLKEQELADRFRVSRSPIRGALKLLAEEEVVERVPHHGTFLRVAGREISWDANGPTAPEEDLYRRVVHDRLAGVLPETLSASKLSRFYGMHRSRLSRLLSDMANEGLVERLPGQHWRFTPALTTGELYDSSYRYRRIIEPAALLEPTFVARPDELEELMHVHQRVIEGEIWDCSYSYLYNVDSTFHETVARWSGNEFIAQGVSHQNRLRRLTEYEYYADRERMLISCREHACVLDALDAGDTKKASEYMRDHIDSAWRSRPRFPEEEARGKQATPGGGTRRKAKKGLTRE